MSRLSTLLPLAVLFLVLTGAAYIGYQIYLWSDEMSTRGKAHMEKKNMTFSKEGGLKVGVKQMNEEAYEGKTQKVLANVWNTSSESRKGSGTSTATGAQTRPSASRHSSQQSAMAAKK